ncbi:hypothetical protein K8R33_02340 [archaeon]|nr:hypothetical protein [archaeon]
MNKYLKLLTTVMMLLMVFTPASLVRAEVPDDSFAITKITIEGVEFEFDEDYTPGDILIYAPVSLDSELEVEVEWEAGNNITEFTGGDLEAKIEVEFDGDDVDTEYFDVESNWHGSETLTIEIDSDDGLLGNEVLNVKMRSRDGTHESEFTILLSVSRERNFVEIYDVNFRQGMQYEAGELMTVSIGVVNEGRNEEEDIYVKMTIPELGLTTRSDRFDLVVDGDEVADDEKYYKLHKTLFLELPVGTPVGVYDVHFEAIYDDGDEKDEAVYSIVVGASSDVTSGISMDTQHQTIGAGKAIVYKVLFDNTNVDYNIEVSGVNFGTVEVREEDDEAYIFVSIDEDTNAGSYDFTVIVKAGTNVLEEFDVTADVVSSDSEASYSDVKSGLEIGFAVLLVILVILGIILVAKKLGKGDEIEEPILDEDQTYY